MQPSTIAELIMYIERHMEYFGFSPSALLLPKQAWWNLFFEVRGNSSFLHDVLGDDPDVMRFMGVTIFKGE